MKRSEAFPSRYISQDEVAERPAVGLIDKTIREEVQDGEGKETKTVLYFSNDVKPIILNGINWDSIAALYGEDSDVWHGKQIELFRDPTVRFGNKVTGGVRVRKPGNGHSPDRQAILDELMATRTKIKELKPELLPAKPTPDQLAGDGLAAQLAAHSLILEAVKMEAAA